MNKYKAWLFATRPLTLFASVSPILIACALASREGTFRFMPAFFCFMVGLFAQIAANLANDYFDFKRGADGEGRLGPPRATSSGWIKPHVMLNATMISLLLTGIAGLGVVIYGGMWLIIVGIVILACAIAYSTGPYPLAYNGWGDLAVLIFFGIIPLCFTYYVITGGFTWTGFFLGAASGMMSINILLVNNFRDYEQDKKHNMNTTVVLFGKAYAAILYPINIIVAMLIALFVLQGGSGWVLLLYPIFLFFFMDTYKDMMVRYGSALNTTLYRAAFNVFLFAMLVSVTIMV